MEILGIAQQGLIQAQGQVDRVAARIARPATEESSPAGDMVSLLSAKNQFEADLGLARTADEMQKKTLDLLA